MLKMGGEGGVLKIVLDVIEGMEEDRREAQLIHQIRAGATNFPVVDVREYRAQAAAGQKGPPVSGPFCTKVRRIISWGASRCGINLKKKGVLCMGGGSRASVYM